MRCLNPARRGRMKYLAGYLVSDTACTIKEGQKGRQKRASLKSHFLPTPPNQLSLLSQGVYGAIKAIVGQLHHVGGLILVVRLGEWELEKLRGGITEAQVR